MVGMVNRASMGETGPVVPLAFQARPAEMVGMVPMDRMRFQVAPMVQMGPMQQMDKVRHSSSSNKVVMSNFLLTMTHQLRLSGTAKAALMSLVVTVVTAVLGAQVVMAVMGVAVATVEMVELGALPAQVEVAVVVTVAMAVMVAMVVMVEVAAMVATAVMVVILEMSHSPPPGQTF